MIHKLRARIAKRLIKTALWVSPHYMAGFVEQIVARTGGTLG